MFTVNTLGRLNNNIKPPSGDNCNNNFYNAQHLQVARYELRNYVSMQRHVDGRCPQHQDIISTRFGGQRRHAIIILTTLFKGKSHAQLLTCWNVRPRSPLHQPVSVPFQQGPDADLRDKADAIYSHSSPLFFLLQSGALVPRVNGDPPPE